MSITVNWITGVISIPKADTVLVQSSPTEIRELDLDTFRLILRDLEEDEDGRPWPATHDHNTSVTVGGVILARVIIMLDPYSITFEDGQYAVNLIGANSNVGDRVNVNQVSVRSANSAGLIDINKEDIEYAAYNEGVTIDETNGSSGDTHPWGTPRRPVDNPTDALTVATVKGFHKLYTVGDATIAGNDFDDFHIHGDHTNLTLSGIENAHIYNCWVGGSLGKACWLTEGVLGDATISAIGWGAFHGWKTALSGPIHLSSIFMVLQDCVAAKSGDAAVEIDLMNTSSTIHAHKWTGNILITNGTVASKVHDIQMTGGHIEIDNTTTEGTFYLTGTGTYINNGGPSVVIDDKGLTNTSMVWAINGNPVHIDTADGTAGTVWPLGTVTHPTLILTDGRTIADNVSSRAFAISGSITLDANYSDWKFKGESEDAAIDLGGQVVNNAHFDDIEITGIMVSAVHAEGCCLSDITGLTGRFENCGLQGTNTSINSPLLINCYDVSAAENAPTLDLTGDTAVDVSMQGYKGRIVIKGMTNGKLNIGILSGHITLDPTCTGGEIICIGVGKLTNNSTATVDATHLVQAPELTFINQWILNKLKVEDTQVVLYDDDGITPLKTWPWDDTTKTRGEAV